LMCQYLHLDFDDALDLLDLIQQKQTETRSSLLAVLGGLTIHGVPLFLEGPAFKRFFWLMVFIICVIILSCLIAKGVQNLNGTETVASFKVNREDYLHMPYIRFCNNHRYNRNRVWQKFQESPRGGVSTLLASYTEPPPLWNIEAWQAITKYVRSYMHNTAQSPDFLGFNRAETIMACEYSSGMQCNISKIIQMPWNDQYGNCFEFYDENLVQTNTGHSRLKFLLNVQSSLGVPLADDLGNGMHVTISSEIAESASTTMIQSNGFSMIGMKKSQIEDLGHPYSDCTDEILDRDYAEICHAECLEQQIIDDCGCTTYWWSSLEDLRARGTQYCASETEWACAGRHGNLHLIDTNPIISCKCKTPCKKDSFELTVRFFPYSQISSQLLQNEAVGYNISDTVSATVYYSTLDVTVQKTDPAYTWFNFWADLGGNAGLLVGASVVSLAELFWVFVVYIQTRYCREDLTETQEAKNPFVHSDDSLITE